MKSKGRRELPGGLFHFLAFDALNAARDARRDGRRPAAAATRVSARNVRDGRHRRRRFDGGRGHLDGVLGRVREPIQIQTNPSNVATDIHMYCSSSHCGIFRFAQGFVSGRYRVGAQSKKPVAAVMPSMIAPASLRFS